MTESALSDIRVLDLAGETGVYASKLLADLGADVIRIEHPDGDPLRDVGPFWHDEGRADRSLSFFNLNTSKRSVTLDIEKPEGREAFKQLVRSADVVVETFAPGYLDALGLGYAGLCGIKPDIILTSITGFGQTGPHAKYRWADIVGVAMSGMMTLAGDPQDPPNRPYGNQGYTGAGIDGAAGTLMALYHRDNTGEGQHVDVSVQEVLSINQEVAMVTWDMNQRIVKRTGGRGIVPIEIPGIGTYKAKDGEIFGYLGTPGGAPWTVMFDWMAEEGLAEDLGDEPYIVMVRNLNMGFLTGLARPERHADLLRPFGEHVKQLGDLLGILKHVWEVFTRFCAAKTKWELYEGGQRRRLLIGIVSTPEDLAKNPQLAARKWYQDVVHDELGATVRYPGPPFRMSETPWAIRRRPPLPGEHTEEVLTELGITEDEIDRL